MPIYLIVLKLVNMRSWLKWDKGPLGKLHIYINFENGSLNVIKVINFNEFIIIE